MTEHSTGQWVIVEPGVIALPTTGYEIRRTDKGEYQAFHNGKRIGCTWNYIAHVKVYAVQPHMRDLLAVGIEP